MRSEPLLHLVTAAQWRDCLAAARIRPSVAEFVHLSTPEQVALPATRLFAGRADLLLLVLDPDRIGVPVRWEAGLPTDAAGMLFPHAYGPVPTSAVLAVLPYRPRADGGFDAPTLPATDPGDRQAGFEPSVLRRAASTEIPVGGGVAVLAGAVPASYQHNQLLIDGDTDVDRLVADADATLGGAGLAHRKALLTGSHLTGTAAGLAERGWTVERLVGMVAPARGAPDPRVEHVEREAVRPMWDADWRRGQPGISAAAVAQLSDRYAAEEASVDLRYLAVHEAGAVVASTLLKIDGGTALVDMLAAAPAFRGRGHGGALLTTALATAAAAGCDLVVLEALATDWPRRWYARRGFVEAGEAWTATRAPAVRAGPPPPPGEPN